MKVSKCSEAKAVPRTVEYPLSYSDILKVPGVYLMEGNSVTKHIVYGYESTDALADEMNGCMVFSGNRLTVPPVGWRYNRYKRLDATVCFEIREPQA